MGHLLGLSHPDADLANEVGHLPISAMPPSFNELPLPVTAFPIFHRPHVGLLLQVLDGATPGVNVHHGLLAHAAYARAAGSTPLALNTSALCLDPWEGVVAGVPAETLADGGDGVAGHGGLVRPSIMQAFTQHMNAVCLFDDDLEALTTLYPSCTTPIHTKPVCFKVPPNIGFVRVGLFILLPVMFAMVGLTLLNACVRSHHLRRLASRDVRLRDKDLQITHVSEAFQASQHDVKRLVHHVREQKVSEASRVERRAQTLAHSMNASSVMQALDRLESACGPEVAAQTRIVRAELLGASTHMHTPPRVGSLAAARAGPPKARRSDALGRRSGPYAWLERISDIVGIARRTGDSARATDGQKMERTSRAQTSGRRGADVGRTGALPPTSLRSRSEDEDEDGEEEGGAHANVRLEIARSAPQPPPPLAPGPPPVNAADDDEADEAAEAAEAAAAEAELLAACEAEEAGILSPDAPVVQFDDEGDETARGGRGRRGGSAYGVKQLQRAASRGLIRASSRGEEVGEATQGLMLS